MNCAGNLHRILRESGVPSPYSVRSSEANSGTQIIRLTTQGKFMQSKTKSFWKRVVSAFVIAGAVNFGADSARAEISDQQFSEMMKKYLSSDAGKESVGNTVQQYFMQKQRMQQADEEKRAKQETEEQFKNPVKVDVGSAPVKGPANAKVTIVEFSDFQCPFCKRGADTMEQVLKAYPKDVKVAFKQLPLPMHPQAKPAAQAALAAGKQGKFWEMHDAMFKSQGELAPAFYEAKAKELGLNVDKFKADMESAEIKKQVEDDMAQAEKLGVQATPGFYVNGVAVRGAYPFEHFKGIIDRWLATK